MTFEDLSRLSVERLEKRTNYRALKNAVNQKASPRAMLQALEKYFDSIQTFEKMSEAFVAKELDRFHKENAMTDRMKTE